MKSPTNKAMALLVKNFDKASGVHTDEGTYPLWGQLSIAGYVKPLPKLGFGHPFEYEITPAGRDALNTFKEQSNEATAKH